jgi:hypothetical protein
LWMTLWLSEGRCGCRRVAFGSWRVACGCRRVACGCRRVACECRWLACGGSLLMSAARMSVGSCSRSAFVILFGYRAGYYIKYIKQVGN